MIKSARRSILFIGSTFLVMLGIWQIDHVFTDLFWDKGLTIEILRFFTIPVFMKLEDIWILCIFCILLGYFSLAIGLNLPNIKSVIRRLKK